MAAFTWFLLGLVGPFLYALTNHIDKHLLSTYFKEDGVLTLIMYSAMLALCVVPIAFIFDSSVLGMGMENMLALAGVAVLPSTRMNPLSSSSSTHSCRSWASSLDI